MPVEFVGELIIEETLKLIVKSICKPLTKCTVEEK